MEFRIADTFTDSLARLTGEEQKAVKTTAFDLQINPSNPGHGFHKLDRAKDKNFWSVRVGMDLRLIVHKTPGSLLLCYVDHHDKAYDWAVRRRLETHPRTGAAQMVEIRETVHEVRVPVYVPHEEPGKTPTRRRPLFERCSDEDLLGYGVPSEWIRDVREADEDSLLVLADRLPREAAEALLELATGGTPRALILGATPSSPFDHPDAQRRFRVMANVDELSRALDFPWDRWTIFLHPEQREWIARDFQGPARVAGSAGTGKTVVAIHRAASLARRHPDSRVLLTTFSDPLAMALRAKLRRLIAHEPRLGERIEVESLGTLALRLAKVHLPDARLAERGLVVKLVSEMGAAEPHHGFSHRFLQSEWDHVVDAWHILDWESYRDVTRLGRKMRLPEKRRATLWAVFERVRHALGYQRLMTSAAMFTLLADVFRRGRNHPFDYVVVDESQDLSVSQARFLAALGGGRPNALFFAGDSGQRIFQQPFSWKSLGIDVRGRSKTLRINYRTSHQIRLHADRLLGAAVTDADGNVEDRSRTVSVFNGPSPVIGTFDTAEAEIRAVASWIKERRWLGVSPDEIAVFVRSLAQMERARAALTESGAPHCSADEAAGTKPGHVTVGTMHLAKGLEFRAVVVMGCDEDVIPLQSRMEQVGDPGDLQEAYDTERQLLYVACTRARDQLLVTAVKPGSEFLRDFESQ